eukprot:869199-Rhodomonas_salina.2
MQRACDGASGRDAGSDGQGVSWQEKDSGDDADPEGLHSGILSTFGGTLGGGGLGAASSRSQRGLDEAM